MTRCSYCQTAIPAGSATCKSCGRPAAGAPASGLAPTVPASESPAQTKDESECGCGGAPVFAEGSLLAERYRIVSRIGTGGMGTVYRAWDERLDQDVALKFISAPCGSAQETAAPQMLNEVKIARRVTHPNVCRVHDIGEIGGCPFFSMEYVDGEDLASLLDRTGRVSPDRAARIARQLCAGLLAAHEQSVLHRDLKPANILLDRSGDVRIVDFGIAAAIGDQQQAGCTPGYVAPELLGSCGSEGSARATVQSDLYSLGVVLHELYSGKPLYRGSSVAELLQTQSRPVPRLPQADSTVEQAILGCLAQEPARRPRSVHAVLAALEDVSGCSQC
ncbi:MAG: serine/threonine-protein kinase [Planctomycetota bacterium]